MTIGHYRHQVEMTTEGEPVMVDDRPSDEEV